MVVGDDYGDGYKLPGAAMGFPPVGNYCSQPLFHQGIPQFWTF